MLLELSNEALPSFIKHNISITDKTYYKMGGHARYFATPATLAEVQKTLEFCQDYALPCAVLGSGSNSVYADGVFEGCVLSLERLSQWHWETEEYLYVEAGVTNTEIAEICALENRAGASWMYRMPGQVGATVRMNARCYGGEISQLVSQVVAFNRNGDLVTYGAQDIFQGYKKTLFMDHPHVVVGVRLHFPKSESAEILIQHMHECEADRHKKKHFFLPSCGSTFKNNYEIGKPSGQVFDELGLKGSKLGDIEVSEFHANFLWNRGKAKTVDMLTLAASMRDKVNHVLGAEVNLEVQPVGCFEQALFYACGMENLGCYFSDEQHPAKKWSGLFSFPVKKEPLKVDYPAVLLHAPFIEYYHAPYQGVPSVSCSLIQLISLSHAQKNQDIPFLKWETQCIQNFEQVFTLKPLQSPGSYVENLWHYSVSEVFFAHAKKPACYLEFEITPDRHWLALKFKGVRQKTEENGVFLSDKKLRVEITSLDSVEDTASQRGCVMSVTFNYNDLRYVLDNSDSFLVQGALSLGNGRYLLAPYWPREANDVANFHQPNKFWTNKLKD